LCPTGADLTSPSDWRIAPQPAKRQRFIHEVRRNVIERQSLPARSLRLLSIAMRFVVLILVLLAGVKVWTQDRTYRSAMGEALVTAYRERAIEICRQQTAKQARIASSTVASLWNASSDAEVTLGDSDISVAIWDTQNPLWSQRFRNPHLILTGAGEPSAHCAYDLHAGIATLSP
jgi:hypothetical protein